MLDNFIKKYKGVKCGNTEANFGECVGLAMLWVKDQGLSHIWGNAKDIYANSLDTEWNKIKNAPNIYPQAGDIIIWDKTMGGGYGHIAIVTESNIQKDTFTVFEQNNPTGYTPKITTYTSWKGVIGWLRPKNVLESKIEPVKDNIDSIVIGELKKELEEMTIEKEKYKKEARENRAIVDSVEKTKKELEELKAENKRLEKQVNDTVQNETLLKDMYEAKISELEKAVKIVTKEVIKEVIVDKTKPLSKYTKKELVKALFNKY